MVKSWGGVTRVMSALRCLEQRDADSSTGIKSCFCMCKSREKQYEDILIIWRFTFVDRGRGGDTKPKKRMSLEILRDDNDVSTKDEDDEKKKKKEKIVLIPGIMSAVDDILKRAGLSLESEKRELIRGHLELKTKLEKTSDELVKKTNALDELRREREEEKKKKICPICLTNNVNRVLVPCGHQLF